ncbi:MAG: CopD family protein [Gammaproteobacteria bacterium]|nr:CopD family protein [Gammaproteobacteria bacterium]
MLWLKALHLIFMVTWFAGLFYLPRLFVYHAMSDDEVSLQRFCVMEQKLLWSIATPGGVLTLLFGFWLLVYRPDLLFVGWMQLKLALIGVLVGYHAWCIVLQRRFACGDNRHGHVWYRWFNEAPVVILIAVVILAVLRPEVF